MAAGRRSLSKSVSLLSKFEGAMIGAVLGDCLGARFEYNASATRDDIDKFFSGINDKQVAKDTHQYTDDTAMARSVAASLIANRKFDATDMAKRFTYEYFREPRRGYGGSVKGLFKQLKDEGYKDPFGPASQAFNGMGSYGNGGAMRIVPAPLFGYSMEEDQLNELVSNVTRLTHAESTAVHGAILEAQAVHYMLRHQAKDVTALGFLASLRELMEKLEGSSTKKPYCEKLDLVAKYLNAAEDTSRETVIKTLGNDVSALESVVTAIYCFLRGMEPTADIQASSLFERCIIYAVTLGGDTDTIASMAGAIAGAYVGVEQIPHPWINCCEGVEDARGMANDLWKLHATADGQTGGK